MKKLKVGLLGLGRTGKIVAESFHNDPRFDVVFAVKKNPPKTFDYPYCVGTKEELPKLVNKFKPQVIIDFTNRQATMQNIKHFKRNTGIVIATTGFTTFDFATLIRMVRKRHLKILYAPNISDGINILMKVSKTIARLWKKADIEIIEQHFKKKKSVSGTAIKISNLFNKSTKIHSIRAGGIVGIHKVIFACANQKIEISHESFSREVFAVASKDAALWLHKRKCGFYNIEEMYK